MKLNFDKKHLLLISTFMLLFFSSCDALKRNIDIVDLESNYEIRYKKDDARNKVFYNKLNGKKLNGYYKGNLRGEGYTFLSFFKKGKRQGISLIFENDFLTSQYFYKNGLKDGMQYNYIGDSTSNVYYISNYRKGIKDGVERAYENEKLTRKSNYSSGIKNGIEYYYNNSGEVIETVDYKHLIEDKEPILDKNIKVNDWLFGERDFSPETFQMFFDYRGTIRIKVRESTELYNENYFSVFSGSYLMNSAIDENSQWLYDENPYYFKVVYDFDGRHTTHTEVWFFYSINCRGCTVDKVKIVELVGHKIYAE